MTKWPESRAGPIRTATIQRLVGETGLTEAEAVGLCRVLRTHRFRLCAKFARCGRSDRRTAIFLAEMSAGASVISTFCSSGGR